MRLIYFAGAYRFDFKRAKEMKSVHKDELTQKIFVSLLVIFIGLVRCSYPCLSFCEVRGRRIRITHIRTNSGEGRRKLIGAGRVI